MPLFHIHGLVVNVLATAVSGAQVLCCPDFSAANSVAWMHHFEVSWYSAVPTMHQGLLQYIQASSVEAPESLQLIRNCSAALLPTIAAQLEQAFGAMVMPTYAMTESMPICSNPRSERRCLDSVGTPAGPEVQIRTPWPDEDVVPEGEHGEVAVRGACVCRGYEVRDHNGDANQEVKLADGFFRTGDRGYMSNGHLYLTGRYKEIINRAGEQISPVLIEDVCIQMPQLSEVIVFAVPHEELGEVVGIAAVCREQVSLQDLRRFGQATGRLQQKWLPQCLVRTDRIHKGPTGKPTRIGLAQLIGIAPLGSNIPFAEYDYLSTTEELLQLGIAAQQCVISDEPASVSDTVLALVRTTCQLEISMDDRFDESGVQSLQAELLCSVLHARLGVRLHVPSLAEHSTPRRLASFIASQLHCPDE